MNNKVITLVEGTDYTLTALASMLNEVYGCKKNGSKFTTDDIHKYMKRGSIPIHYGGSSLVEISNCSMGLKMVRVCEPHKLDNNGNQE